MKTLVLRLKRYCAFTNRMVRAFRYSTSPGTKRAVELTTLPPVGVSSVHVPFSVMKKRRNLQLKPPVALRGKNFPSRGRGVTAYWEYVANTPIPRSHSLWKKVNCCE